MSVDAASLTSGAEQSYFEGLLTGEIRVQQCSGCSEISWPAVFRCSKCGGWEHSWKPVAPEGQIYSWTRTWHEFGGPQAYTAPFVPVVVTLSEAPGVRLIGTLENPDGDVRIGRPVRGSIRNVEFLGRHIPALSWALV